MGTSNGSDITFYVVMGILFLIIIFCIRMIIVTSKIKKQGKINRQKLKESGVIHMTGGSHMAGLPLAEGTYCNIHEYADKFIFKAGGSDFTLVKDKITDISVKTDEEITSHYVSSIGGAVAGGVLFGPLGAIVGGRTKKKKDKTVYRYLIFTYLKEETVDYISFDVTTTFAGALRICTEFKTGTGSAKVSVDL